MGFWVRHVFLVLACVVGPFVAALYVDTTSEIHRAHRAGEIAARLAAQGLEARLTLDAHGRVSRAISLAQRFEDRDLIGELATRVGTRRETSLAAVVELLNEATPQGGFAWLVDDQGNILARSGAKGGDVELVSVVGHPLFLETQEGNALDGIWRDPSNKVALMAAAPLIVRGQAQGAVMIAQAADRSLTEGLAAALDAGVTFAAGDTVIASTLDAETASLLLKSASQIAEPVSGGSLKEPLSHPWIPLLPLFVDHQARGLAYTSLSFAAPGLRDMRWLISVDSAPALRALPVRQELVLSGLAIFTMLAILIGLVNHRTFVSPIDKITAHLSELQLGRGELEYPESRVPAPFRRMVKLINMTVQKIPARGFSPRGTGMIDSPISPISEIGSAERVPPPRDGSTGASLLRNPETRTGDAVQGYSAPVPQGPGTGDLVLSPPPPAQTTRTLPPIPKQSTAANQPPPILLSQLESGDNHGRMIPSPPPLGGARSALSPSMDEADAIASAIASLESTPSPPLARPRGQSTPRGGPATGDLMKPKQIRSAADIRGVPSESMGMPSPFAPSASEMFRSTPGSLHPPRPDDQAVDARLQSMPRGGGSLLGPGGVVALGAAPVPTDGFNPESTVVAPVEEELLRKSATREDSSSTGYRFPGGGGQAASAESAAGEMTMVASVPANLLAQTIADPDSDSDNGTDLSGLDAADHAHFKETYERFLEMRKRCGETTADLAFDRFLQKLTKNREGLIKKYNCRTVRFQVYEKDGKAALKATPVRAR